MSKSYKLNSGRNLYYSPLHCKFSMDFEPDWGMPDYANTELNYLRLEISHACNGYCSYCIVFKNEVQNLSRLNIQEFWDWLTSQEWYKKITGIFVIGGEPLLFYDDILFLMNHFDGAIHFSSNGTLITEEMAREFKKRDVLVYVSLDGILRKENCNRIYTDGGEMYDDILRGLALLEDAGVRKGIFMVATPENIVNITDTMINLSKKYDLLRIGYSLPHWTIHEGTIITPEQYRDALCELYDHRDQIHATVMQVEWRLFPMANGITKKFSCALHTEQMTILPDMSVVRCSKIDHDPVLRQISNQELDENCPIACCSSGDCRCSGCIALGSCGGGCPYDGMKRFGTIIDQRECIITPAIVSKGVNDVVAAVNRAEKLSKLVPPGVLDSGFVKKALEM